MCMKSDALYRMAKRYEMAARQENDLQEAEKLTTKCIEYFEQWQEVIKR